MTKAAATKKTDEGNQAPRADAKLERLIKVWKGLHLIVKNAEPKLKLVREDLAAAIQKAGVTALAFKVDGVVALEHRENKSIDIEQMLKDDGLTAEAIEAKITKYTKVSVSAPFVTAPRAWSAEAKAAR